MNLDDDTVDELPAPPRKDIPAADRELLELAARALGARFEEVDGEGYGNLHFEDGSIVHAWNPLQFSGDTFELQVRMKMQVSVDEEMAVARCAEGFAGEPVGSDPTASARRAVMRVAAEVGKQRS